MQDDVYFRRRADQERDWAERAADANVRAIHLDLAARYASLTDAPRDPVGDPPARR